MLNADREINLILFSFYQIQMVVRGNKISLEYESR